MNIEIDNIQGFDKNGNKVIELNNTQFDSIGLIKEITKAINQFGIESEQLAQNMKLIATIANKSLLRPEADEKTEILNQKTDLENFNQIEWNEDFLKLSEDNEFLS